MIAHTQGCSGFWKELNNQKIIFGNTIRFGPAALARIWESDGTGALLACLLTVECAVSR